MADYSLFLNGVFEEVLDDIYKVHQFLPEQVLYLQPYAGQPIKNLADEPPSVDDPLQLFLSLMNRSSNDPLRM